MSTIPLHPTRGLDPHLTYCPRCGGEGSGLTIGRLMKGTTYDGRTVFFQAGQKRTVERDMGISIQHVEEAKEGERVPDNDICDSCKQEIATQKEVIEAGGVYFRCKECHCEGVIKPNDFTEAVRKHSGIEAPNPVGVEFDHCTEHGGGNE